MSLINHGTYEFQVTTEPAETAFAIIEELAEMKTDEELGGDMSGDDAVSVLSGLIERARALV